jgi:hypothetical protein
MKAKTKTKTMKRAASIQQAQQSRRLLAFMS